MTRPRYGLQRDGRWLLPPAFDLKTTSLTDDPAVAWVAISIDAAILRRDLLRQAFGITTTIRSIPPEFL
jgi:alpha-D-ribose 1-methylphosphonate 5-triphosphate diphosphatase PhnM